MLLLLSVLAFLLDGQGAQANLLTPISLGIDLGNHKRCVWVCCWGVMSVSHCVHVDRSIDRIGQSIDGFDQPILNQPSPPP